MIAKFWWGQKETKKKIHWLSWAKLCRGKKEGGLGFKDLHLFNLALLAKHVWRLMRNSDSLFSQVFKAKYFPQSNFLQAKIGSNSSYVWQIIMAAQNILQSGTQWQIGNASQLDVWCDKWTHCPLVTREPPCFPYAGL
jgi:hypothetical protein